MLGASYEFFSNRKHQAGIGNILSAVVVVVVVRDRRFSRCVFDATDRTRILRRMGTQLTERISNGQLCWSGQGSTTTMKLVIFSNRTTLHFQKVGHSSDNEVDNEVLILKYQFVDY